MNKSDGVCVCAGENETRRRRVGEELWSKGEDWKEKNTDMIVAMCTDEQTEVVVAYM